MIIYKCRCNKNSNHVLNNSFLFKEPMSRPGETKAKNSNFFLLKPNIFSNSKYFFLILRETPDTLANII